MALDEGKEAAIAFLSRPREIDRKIQRTKDAIRDARLALTSISVSYSDMPKGGGGPTSRTEEGVVAIMMLEEKLRRLEEERAQVVDEVADMILKLTEPEEQEVLTELYVLGKGWDDAVEASELSRGKFRKVRESAINNVIALRGGEE